MSTKISAWYCESYLIIKLDNNYIGKIIIKYKRELDSLRQISTLKLEIY